MASAGAGVAVCAIGVGFSGSPRNEGLGIDGGDFAVAGSGVDVCETGMGFTVRTGGEDTGVGRGRSETGVRPECTEAGACDTASIPPVCLFARPGGMQPDDPGEQPHPVLLP